MGFSLKVVRMQNNYGLHKDFFASTTGDGLLRKGKNRL